MSYALKMGNFNENMKDELERTRETRVVFIFLKKTYHLGTTYT